MSNKWRACLQAKDDDDENDNGGSDDDGDDDHHHDDHDHNHQDNDFYDDDDDDDTEMMIRALRVSWVNCGKVGGLYCSMVQYCTVMKIKQNITFLIKNFNQLFLLLRKLIRSKHINFV